MIKIPSDWVYISWDELKIRNGLLDYLGKASLESEIFPFKTDGPLIYYTTFTKAYSGTIGDECKDFYDNYKNEIDINIPKNEVRSDDGLIVRYDSPRPYNCTTVFTGFGDDTSTTESSGIGNGNCLCFSIPASSESEYIELEFQDDIYLKDGFMMAKDAPFGSSVDMDIYHPTIGKIANFVKRAPIYGGTPIYLDSEDRALIEKGLKIRVTVYNSNPDIHESHDQPKAFKASGRLEIYRENSV